MSLRWVRFKASFAVAGFKGNVADTADVLRLCKNCPSTLSAVGMLRDVTEFNIGKWDPQTGKYIPQGKVPQTEPLKYYELAMLQAVAQDEVQLLETIEHMGILGTSHEQLAKDVSGIEGMDRSVGKDVKPPQHFVGFTVFKYEGSKEWPHKVQFRSGNMKFMHPLFPRDSGGGKTCPKDWMEGIHHCLEKTLPTRKVMTRPRAMAAAPPPPAAPVVVQPTATTTGADN